MIVNRLPQLCFHGNPDTKPCPRCRKDGGGDGSRPVKLTAGPYHRAEIIPLAPEHSQWIRECESRAQANAEDDECAGKARFLAVWFVGSSRRRRLLCPNCLPDFCRRARIKPPVEKREG
jgi:hypothetical protein